MNLSHSHLILNACNLFSLANDITDSDSEIEDSSDQPKIVKILFDCIDCSNSFPSRIALEKHECSTETVHNKCNVCFKK